MPVQVQQPERVCGQGIKQQVGYPGLQGSALGEGCSRVTGEDNRDEKQVVLVAIVT